MKTQPFASKQVVPLLRGHAATVASLHIEGINTGFISSLGPRFVSALYEGIAGNPHGFGFVAVTDDGDVVGFVAFAANLSRIYRSLLLRAGPKFALTLASKLFSWGRIRRIGETLFYPRRSQGVDLPAAELLSIAVAPRARGCGLGARLIQVGLAHCQALGIDAVKVLVSADNTAANHLYLKCGFQLAVQTTSHGIPSNIYVGNLAPPALAAF